MCNGPPLLYCAHISDVRDPPPPSTMIVGDAPRVPGVVAGVVDWDLLPDVPGVDAARAVAPREPRVPNAKNTSNGKTYHLRGDPLNILVLLYGEHSSDFPLFGVDVILLLK